MSEFKFACPVCGQHITCDSGSSGSTMACPTCFRQLVVPQASAVGGSNLVLNAAEVQSRPIPLPGNGGAEAGRVPPRKSFPWAALALGLVVCTAAAAAFVFRGKILSRLPKAGPVTTNLPAPATPLHVAERPTGWTLNLADAKIPEAPAASVINGQSNILQRAIIRGDLLILWPGTNWPPDLGFAVKLSQFAKRAEELAGQTVIVEATQTNAPRMVLRWKDEQGQSVTQDYHEGYALRLEFGAVADTRLPGKIYLAAPDDGRSYVAGTFDLEIRKPKPSKPPPQP